MKSVCFARLTSIAVLAVGLLVSAQALAAQPTPSSNHWKIVPSPNAFSGNNQLNGVAGISAQDAWAVGSSCCSARHFGLGTLAEHWDGSAWTIAAGSVDTRYFDEKLLGVAAVASNDVWAVGNVKREGFYDPGVPLTMHWNGSAWSQVAVPGSGWLSSVAALSSTNVWAAGATRTATQIERWNGSSWAVVPSPSPGPKARLDGIAAVSPNDIWAAGWFVDNAFGGIPRTLIEHWDGSSWTIVASPNATGPNSLHSVTAVSANDVWAVGESGVDTGSTGDPPGSRTLVEHWNGSNWQIVESPNVDYDNVLRGVAARSANDVRTVGHFTFMGGEIPTGQTEIVEFRGAGLYVTPSPNANTSDNLLNGVAVTGSTGPMWAVGFHLNETAPYQTLVLRGD
jgi:hypothetical protein